MAVLGCKKSLVVTDQGVIKAKIADRIVSVLTGSGIETEVYGSIEPNPSIATVNHCGSVATKGGFDSIVGLGGGSALDAAKAAALLATNGGDMRNYIGREKFFRPGLALILVPTTAGTGSEASMTSVVIDEADQVKKAAYSRWCLPSVALVDPELTVSMPPTVTIDTGMDALIHGLESYTSVRCGPISAVLAAESIRLAFGNLRKVHEEPGNIESRKNMSLASLMAGMAFAGSSLGAIHGLSYPLNSECGLTHGRANIVLMLEVMAHNRTAVTSQYAAVASLMGVDVSDMNYEEASIQAIKATQALLTDLDVPIRLRDYGIKRSDIKRLAETGLKVGAHLVASNPRPVNPEDAIRIYEEAW
jgi:alcohol dehydrogenase class IV